MKTGWWYRATREQKLAQIDAGIELGMTAKQVAMNCGCRDTQDFTSHDGSGTVQSFAYRNDRHFPRISDTLLRKLRLNGGVEAPSQGKRSRRTVRIDEAKEAWLSGAPVNIWEVE